MQLSVTQRHILSTGGIVGWFDVYGGYWWTFGPQQKPISKATMNALENQKCVVASKYERVFSGRQMAKYEVTKEAKQALRQYAGRAQTNGERA